MTELRETLRGLPVLGGPILIDFDPTDAPPDPRDIFRKWLESAIEHDVPEPHAMTLSTARADGFPDSRTLILKDVDDVGFHFAITGASRKGRQLDERMQAALTFYWQPMVRQVRVRGNVVYLGDEASAADYLDRPDGSRAAAMLGRQSDELGCGSELEAAYSEAMRTVSRDPDVVSPHWRLYAVRPEEVEFWQGAASRCHVRLRYTHLGNGFRQQLLWP